MYKKFLVSMLLTVALAGCGHQSSDKQGDQMDTALPIQDQITNPAPVNGAEPANPATAEPTQTPPSAATDTTQPAAGTTTPNAATITPATDKDAAAAAKSAADAAASAADAAASAAKAAQ
ncbi:hypothetical protein [Rickettsiella endosymbiont of Dermanyssus gallinae]|uniref:hypothetical protein n=1 Tax=Rickettsiella endosymbiont of Dermanyssus gallinae TaxID=2856608 RepID=UPI001C52B91A|nr:hypothetical protein [Rickettsiella endosymbiont of Dermanyssus gallinae]